MREKHQLGRKLKIDDLRTFDPITKNQLASRKAWKEEEHNLVLSGSAGTGKTFTAFYLALEDVLDKSTPWQKIHLIRSVVPTREVGFLPGTIEEKLYPYVAPYIAICEELFDQSGAYNNLVDNGIIEFHSSSFLRGTTFDDSIIIVDEMQNLTYHELDSVITRVGMDTKIMFCGDYYQSDFAKQGDKDGVNRFLQIVELLRNFSIIEFGWSDIVRSDFVRDYIMTKEMIERKE